MFWGNLALLCGLFGCPHPCCSFVNKEKQKPDTIVCKLQMLYGFTCQLLCSSMCRASRSVLRQVSWEGFAPGNIKETCSWLLLGFSWPLLRCSWPLLSCFWPLLRGSWPLLVLSWAALGRSWAILGALLAALGPLLAALGRSWGALGRPWGAKSGLKALFLTQKTYYSTSLSFTRDEHRFLILLAALGALGRYWGVISIVCFPFCARKGFRQE